MLNRLTIIDFPYINLKEIVLETQELLIELRKMLDLNKQNPTKLITRSQASVLIGKSPATIARWEAKGNFPKSKRSNTKCQAMYVQGEIDNWIKSNA